MTYIEYLLHDMYVILYSEYFLLRTPEYGTSMHTLCIDT